MKVVFWITVVVASLQGVSFLLMALNGILDGDVGWPEFLLVGLGFVFIRAGWVTYRFFLRGKAM